MTPIQITCPVCLEPLPQTARQCPKPDCGFVLPDRYVRTCEEAPPLPIAAIGYSGHGKTHLLAAIVLTLRHLANHPPGNLAITYEVLDENTRRLFDGWIQSEQRTRTLPPTPARPGRVTPMILRVSGLFPARTLLVYDVAGQSFHDMTQGHVCLPALRDAQTVWFLMSPHDVLRAPDDTAPESPGPLQELSNLFAAYKTAMERLDAPLEGRSAVIILGKGDKIGDEGSALREYLDADPLRVDGATPCTNFSLPAYEQPLRDISPRIEEYVCGVADVRNMVNLLRQREMRVAFSVTSALGKDPQPGFSEGEWIVGTPWARQRVLDPLIWTLLLEKQRHAAQTHLILDPGPSATEGYPRCGNESLPALLWARLPQHKGVRTWFLGRPLAATSPGQPPPADPPRARRPRLIGRLLDPLTAPDAPSGNVVLVTNQVIPDLADFRNTDWARRLLLITSSDRPEVRDQWPHSRVIQSADDLAEVVEFITASR